MTKRVAYCGVLSSLSFIIGYLERLIPFNFGVPGMKIGFSNIVVLIALYLLSKREAFFVLVIKVLLTGIFFSGPSGFLYSLSGGLMSFFIMASVMKIHRIGIAGVSVAGAVCHNLGQILTACAVLETLSILTYLPVLIFFGVAAGLINATATGYTLKLIKQMK